MVATCAPGGGSASPALASATGAALIDDELAGAGRAEAQPQL
jgi:hypothetical protein